MVDKELLAKKIRKVEGILDDIEEEKGADNKLFRAYHRKLETYHDLLSDGSSDGDDNSTIDGAKGSAQSLADSSVEDPSQGGSVDIKMIEKKYKKVTKILDELEDEHGEEVKERKDYTKFLKKKMEYAEVLGISAEPPLEPGKHGKINIIIAGAPASGKGTQCEVIKEEFGVVHLSTGDMLRAAVAAKTAVGKMAKDFMVNGKLVPDEVIIGIVKDRLDEDDCKMKGWLLDGFPRTQAQAEALAGAGIEADCFVFLDVPDEILVGRVIGRRTDPVTGKIYHMTFSPPTDEEILNRLEQRSDDTEEKVKVRLEQFHANVEAVKGSYKNILVSVDGSKAPKEVCKKVIAKILATKNGDDDHSSSSSSDSDHEEEKKKKKKHKKKPKDGDEKPKSDKKDKKKKKEKKSKDADEEEKPKSDKEKKKKHHKKK